MSEGAGKGYRCRSYGKSYWGSAYWDRVCQEVGRGDSVEDEAQGTSQGEQGECPGSIQTESTEPNQGGAS